MMVRNVRHEICNVQMSTKDNILSLLVLGRELDIIFEINANDGVAEDIQTTKCK